jgi:hypothetical protein
MSNTHKKSPEVLQIPDTHKKSPELNKIPEKNLIDNKEQNEIFNRLPLSKAQRAVMIKFIENEL